MPKKKQTPEVPPPALSAVPDDVLDLLVDVRRRTEVGGSKWSLPPWRQTRKTTKWLGVVLEHVDEERLEDGAVVVRLSLPCARMNGVLPPLSNLEGLRVLHLAGNRLKGKLPVSLPSTLEVLDVSKNAFDNRLIAQWGVSIPSLRTLSVARNKLSGPLPSKWALLVRLSRLDVSNNRLTGTRRAAAFATTTATTTNELTLHLSLSRYRADRVQRDARAD